MKKALKITLWVLMAIVLLLAGVVASTIRLLRPERLTPIAVELANKMLDADVGIANVELELRKTFPFLNIGIDSISIVSRTMQRLPQAARDTIPANADTLLTIDRLHGGINLANLMAGKIALNDLVIDGPMVNVVLVTDSINNFSIMPPSDDTAQSSPASMPDIRIKSFRIANPKKLRYHDLATNTYLDAKLVTAELLSSQAPKGESPTYRIEFDTNVDSPLLSTFGLANFPIVLDGTIQWDHNWPMKIELRDFKFVVSVLAGTFDTAIDFSDLLTINDFHLDLDPISYTEVVEMLPEATRREFGIPDGLNTDATLGVAITLQKPYVAGTTIYPYASASLLVPDCSVTWGKMHIDKLRLNAEATIEGDNLDRAVLHIKDLSMSGPATSIEMYGNITNCISDPAFSGNINGKVVLDKLPPVLSALIDNAYTSGTVTLHTDVNARQSMFSRDHFHELQIKGDVGLDHVYYLASDTLTMYYVQTGKLRFGSNEKYTMTSQRGKVHTLDSLLRARIEIDSARILASGLDMRARAFALDVHALNNSDTSSDTTAIIPMGGNISAGTFSLFTISDSAGVKIRDLSGSVSMRRYKGDTHLPLFRLNAKIARVSTGNNSTRFMMSGGKLNVRINKLPDTELSHERKQVKHIADSILRAKPDIPIDSVYHLAMEIRRRNKRHGKRVLSLDTEHQEEIIDWGVTPTFKHFLTDWKLSGTFTAERAGLFTSAFPIRNRVRNLNAKFCNDSIVLENIQYKAGHSDFTISGTISNMVKAFTGRPGRNTIKADFAMVSDTIDANQLAHAFFSGAANGEKRLEGNLDDEKALERIIDEHSEADTIGPLLIPVNLDAEFSMKANTVLYSDFVLHNLAGTMLAYDGAINIHDLSASSDVGAMQLSALYAAPTAKNMRFGFGLKLHGFNIAPFLKLAPAIDSIMPMMRDLGGIINANIAATSDIDPHMDLVMPSLRAAVNLQGDSIVFLDKETFNKVAKWLLFKDKNENLIKHMDVNLIVEDNVMQLFPFVFDLDRYRLGVQGFNDLDMNYDYHIAVLKSPIPFKFGINVRGHGDKFKIRLGRARYNEAQAIEKVSIADTTRVNLVSQFENVFRRGVRNSDFARLQIDKRPEAHTIDLDTDTISAADSLYFREQGLLPPLLDPATGAPLVQDSIH